MARITIEDCSEQVGNRFALVLMASLRAKQLRRGAKSMVREGENKAVVVSLREIAAGLVKPELETPDPTVAGLESLAKS